MTEKAKINSDDHGCLVFLVCLFLAGAVSDICYTIREVYKAKECQCEMRKVDGK